MLHEKLVNSSRFQQFVGDIEQQMEMVSPDRSSMRTALAAESSDIEDRCRGWIQSLSKSSLPAAVRATIEEEFERAQHRLKDIAVELASVGTQDDRKRTAMDPDAVAGEDVSQLQESAGQNPSAANLMLSQHIEGIYCGPDGRVVVRTCKLGALAGALDLVPRQARIDDDSASANADCGGSHVAEPRRRTRRDTGDAIEDDDLAARAGDFAVDPQRFAGLGPEWFTEDVFEVPRRRSWAEEHAAEVAEYRLRNHASMEATARHFGKTVPTIREAQRYAKDVHGIDAFGKSVSQKNRPHWARDHAAEVAAFLREPGRKPKDAVVHFGKSEPTLRKAVILANEAAQAGTVPREPLVGNGTPVESADGDMAYVA